MREQNRQGPSSRRMRAGGAPGLVLILVLALLSACGSQSAAPSTSAPTTAAVQPAAPTAAAAQPAAPTTAAAEPVAPTAAAEPAATAQAPTSGATTIRWMIWSDDISKEKNLNDEMKLFNDTHSDVKIELIGVPWNDFASKLQALVAAGTPPDILAIQNEADFVSKGFLLPLEDLMAKDNIDKSRFLPGGVEPAYDGKIYGFRHDTAYWLLYYNKDLFDKAGMDYPPASGWTIDQFMDAACKLSKPQDGQWGMHNLNWLTGILAKQQDLPYLEMVNGVPQYRIDDSKTLAWYQKVADFINKDNCQPNADQNSSLGGADPFLAGKSAMQFNGNWGFGNMKEKAPFKWAVVSLPGLKQPNVGMKVGIIKASKNQEAAWMFLKWLTYDPEATRFRAEHGMGQPALNDEQAIKTFLSGPTAPEGLDAVFKVLSDSANSFDWPTYPGQSEAENIINPESDAVMQGLNQANDVIPPAVQKANQVLTEQWKKAAAK